MATVRRLNEARETAAPHDGAVRHQLTIEQLAAETGMSVRNIRSHQARGLLEDAVERLRPAASEALVTIFQDRLSGQIEAALSDITHRLSERRH
jgi:hypothetical protein